MAKSYVHEIGDKLSNGSTAANLPKHIKEIAPIMYNDGNGNYNSIQTALNGKAASSHNHDSRYYTESEIDTKLNGKAASNHTHTMNLTAVSTASDFQIVPGSNFRITAGGSSKVLQIVEPTESYPATIKAWEPISDGQFQGQHKYCPESRTLYEWVGDRWIPLNNTHHRLIVQIKYLKINPSDSSLYPRNVVCDKTDFTGSGSSIVFKPVDPYMMAWWYNRGDSFELGREVSTDPWGDGYPTWITEFQFIKDSGNDRYYCTNMASVLYDASTGSMTSRWCNYITDYSTGSAVKYLEFQQW
jgi:hypothetical protein